MNLFSASGRFDRSEWWASQFLVLGAWVALFFVSGWIGLATGLPALSAMIIVAGGLAIAWMNIASSIKRFHDRDKSWTWILIAFIPIVGPIWLLVELGFFPGTPSQNPFGRTGGGDKAFDSAMAEVKRQHGDGRADNSAWAAARAAIDGDATAKAAKQNAKKYRNIGASNAGGPRPAFGTRA